MPESCIADVIAELPLYISTDLESLSSGESLMDRLLHVTVDTPSGPREIPFNITRDGNELIFCVDGCAFRSTDVIPSVGKVSEIITNITAENESVRLHSDTYGYADIRRERAGDVVRILAEADPSEERIQFQVAANYVPEEGSDIQKAYSFYQSLIGIFGSARKKQPVYNVTFLRDRPLQIVQSGQ